MKKMSAVSMLLLLGVGMLCVAMLQSRQGLATTRGHVLLRKLAGSMWVAHRVTNFGGQTDYRIRGKSPYPIRIRIISDAFGP